MANFLYIQAIVQNDLSDGPGSIRFRHTVVSAKDEHDALSEGGRWSDAFPPHPKSVRVGQAKPGYRPDIETINDYAVWIP